MLNEVPNMSYSFELLHLNIISMYLLLLFSYCVICSSLPQCVKMETVHLNTSPSSQYLSLKNIVSFFFVRDNAPSHLTDTELSKTAILSC